MEIVFLIIFASMLSQVFSGSSLVAVVGLAAVVYMMWRPVAKTVIDDAATTIHMDIANFE